MITHSLLRQNEESLVDGPLQILVHLGGPEDANELIFVEHVPVFSALDVAMVEQSPESREEEVVIRHCVGMRREGVPNLQDSTEGHVNVELQLPVLIGRRDETHVSESLSEFPELVVDICGVAVLGGGEEGQPQAGGS